MCAASFDVAVTLRRGHDKGRKKYEQGRADRDADVAPLRD
jgi:hypothetical protein